MIARFLQPPFKQKASSLVTTLMVIVVLTVIVVAFMQSMSIERMTSRSYANKYEADLAAKAGLNTATQWLSTAIGTNRNFIVAMTNSDPNFSPVLLVGLRDASVATNLYPMISGPLTNFVLNLANSQNLDSYLANRTNLASSNTVNLNVGQSLIQATNSTNYYRAPWIYLTNAAGEATARYAFILTDEQARVNPFLHAGFSGMARTNFGRDASEIRVDFPGANVVSNATQLNAVRARSKAMLTPHTLAQELGSAYYASNKHLISIHTAVDEDVIPAGYLTVAGGVTNFVAYADAGKPKYNLNELATNLFYGTSASARATNIANIISSNLPTFYLRDPSLISSGEDLTGMKYLRRLAASIVDYVDTDTVPTLVNGGEPAGRELAAYAVGFGERNTWVSETASTPYRVGFKSEFFVQLWNPHTLPVSGTIRVSITNRQTVTMPNGGIDADLNDFTSADIAVTLQPNEFRVYNLGESLQDLVNPTTRPSASNNNYPTWSATSSSSSSLTGHPAFSLQWNGALLDMNRRTPLMQAPAAAGIGRTAPGKQFGPVNAVRWNFNFAPANSPNTVADPRGNYLSQTDWLAFINIANALWQGRAGDTQTQASQDFVTTWLTRDYVRANPAKTGIPLSAAGDNPTSLASQYSAVDATNAIAVVTNSAMVSLGELGNIFDPAQVDNNGTANSGGSPANYTRAIGGRTLRIGQAEFAYWNQSGKRAIQLMDLFTLNPLGTNFPGTGLTNYPVMQGRINVNTAPDAVLQAVLQRLAIDSDRGVASATNISANISATIISNRPYSRLSDLSKAISAFADGANFRNTNFIPNVAGTNQMAVMDRAREELFARSYNLFSTQSRAFRIFVVGQALDKKGRSVAQSVIESAIQLEPRGQSSGFNYETTYFRQQ